MKRALPGGFWLMIALLALTAAAKAVLYDTLDPDCFWHLRVAEQLQHDGIGPLVDQISFASEKAPWTPYSWLAELGMKAIWDHAGFRGAIAAQALLAAAFVVFVALAARAAAQRDNPLAIILAVVFAMYLSLPYLSFRPVTFAIVMVALSSWLLLRDRALGQRSRAVWLIVPIALLTINCHFFALLIPAAIVALLVGAIIERTSTSSASIRRYTLMLALTLLSCAATPMLPGMLASVWRYQFADPMVGAGVVAEFQPIWAGAMGLVTVALLLVWIALLFYKRNVLRAGEIIWCAGLFILLLRLGRFAPLFAPPATALLAKCLPRFSRELFDRISVRMALTTIVSLGMIRIAVAMPRNDQLSVWLNRHGPDTPGYPCAAADFVADHVPRGRLLNEFTWGGYLAWRLGPASPVLMDGRTQLYSPQFWRDMISPDATSRQRIARDCGAVAAVLPKTRSTFAPLLLQENWRIAFEDDRAIVLVPPGGEALAN